MTNTAAASSANSSTRSSGQSAAVFTPSKLYRVLAIAEAITWTLLITGLILRATAGLDETLFTTVGAVHGFVFISYGATAILVAINQRWKFGVGLLAVITAIIPYATIPFEIVQERRGALAGGWRLTQTDDPRDNHWFDRFIRWFLNRPALLVTAIVVAIVLIFVILLTAGPPGGK
jgi:integral membrane protein